MEVVQTLGDNELRHTSNIPNTKQYLEIVHWVNKPDHPHDYCYTIILFDYNKEYDTLELHSVLDRLHNPDLNFTNIGLLIQKAYEYFNTHKEVLSNGIQIQ